MKRLLTILLLSTGVFFSTSAQTPTPLLERTVAISFDNEKTRDALKRIADAAGFSFSYNASLLDEERKITATFRNASVRQILDHIFEGAIEYKERPRHIILVKSKPASKKKDEKTVKGYVIDESTGKGLANITIYDPIKLTSSLTNEYGYFELKVDKSISAVKLANPQYRDTTISLPRNGRLLNVHLNFDKEKFRTRADTIRQQIKRFWKTRILYPKNPNLFNVDDTLYREFQFSFVPFVGTNHQLSGNVINDFSFNLIGGYSLGVREMELGGVFNIQRGDASNVQVAGAFNVVGGKFFGGQVAGLFNTNYDTTYGVQVAGLANLNWQSASFTSIAGVLNLTRQRAGGVHISGVGNITMGEAQGVHVGGVFNLATEAAGPVQFAGVMNYAGGASRGSQAAGVLNIAARNHRGSQVAGVLNFTGKELTGSQVGLINFAKRVNGSQLGLVNITDSARGVPVGLLSIVLQGYHKIEVSADEIFYTNLSVRTGVRKFYNILTVGAKPDTFEKDITYWTFGYGFGTARKLSNHIFLNLDLTANQIMSERRPEHLNMLNKLYVGVDFQTTKNFSIAIGATLNGYLTKNIISDNQSLFSEYMPGLLSEHTFDDANLKTWIGGKIGLRFL
ncbi:MAG TPA: STN and carboxypeptidase regulatory-like domain-containing protein [Chryseosolibacter sp.]|nr:STN and carboxypeptidase regulatory-like domain-containing protein [Chryseosolibacter sp.]